MRADVESRGRELSDGPPIKPRKITDTSTGERPGGVGEERDKRKKRSG